MGAERDEREPELGDRAVREDAPEVVLERAPDRTDERADEPTTATSTPAVGESEKTERRRATR